MRTVLMALPMALFVIATLLAQPTPQYDPHGDPDDGVLRVETNPPTRGECVQCHPTHGDANTFEVFPILLFSEPTNGIAYFEDAVARCHAPRPQSYPLTELDRIPETEPDAGYFEANVGGVRRVGLEYRGRWPGRDVYSNPGVTVEGHLLSPHAYDSDMPRQDAGGEGLCLNCHDPHGSNERDLLIGRYGGIGGHAAVGPPAVYGMCLDCHGPNGPQGMELSGQYISDYYDPALNGDSAGHQIRFNPAVAISWPSNIRAGDMLPCYDCHNPHGSEGNDGTSPNAFVISDQRRGWSGLTDTLNDAEQNRRFCLGCHIPSDGIPGSEVVEGIVMNTLSSGVPQHAASMPAACNNCHGRSYASPTSHNVHNPGAPGPDGNPDIQDPWSP